MKVILLLAGKSKRFWPLGEKTLFPLCGKTLLEHQVERLRAAGLEEILLVGGEHNLEEARSIFPDFPLTQQENLELGMRGALLSALPQCGTDSVLIVCGNDIIEPNGYQSLIEAVEKDDVQGALLAQEVDRYFPGGYLTVDGDRITGIEEKPGEGNEPSNLVNIVTHIHGDASLLLEALQEVDENRDDGYEQGLQKLFGAHRYSAVPYLGTWQAVKYPWHLLELLPILLDDIREQSIHSSATVHPTAVITGNVILKEGVKIMPHATVVGPCFVGKDSIIANNALVRGSSIGESCVVGYNSEVKGSIFHSDIWTHMTYIGDSVIGRNVSFGGGSVIGNLRLDEQPISSVVNGREIDTGLVKFGTIIGNNCRLGIQTGMNPGVKIGSGSFISSGTFLSEDVPEKQFARMKDGVVKISENRTPPPPMEKREEFRKKI